MIRVLALLAALFVSVAAEAADRYWVGGGSSTNWNATGNTNWSATSGGANNASVPGTGDNVFFDANSGTGNSIISASQSIGTLDCTGYTGTLTVNSAVVLTVDGAGGVFKLAAGMTYSPSSGAGVLTFTGTSGTMVITTAGKAMQGITINGAGGTFQLGDALTANTGSGSGSLTFTAGTFDANDFAVNIYAFSSNNSNTRTLTMGNGTWTITRPSGSAFIWDIRTTTNLTFNKEGAGIVFSGGTAASDLSFQGGGLTYNSLTINAPSANVSKVTAITGANTFSALNIAAGNKITISATQTLGSAPTWVGTAAAPIIIESDSLTAARTLSVASGTVSLTWGALRLITGSGGATFSATNSFNLGDVTGWSISNPTAGGGAHVVGG